MKKIIKQGILPENIIYEGACPRCETTFHCNVLDLHGTGKTEYASCPNCEKITIACPVIHKNEA